MNANAAVQISDEIHAHLQTCVQHLQHILPTQAPLRDFIHHNTLHGFQHLPFAEALAQAGRLLGARPWLDEAQCRALYRQGRITQNDLDAALRQLPPMNVDADVDDELTFGTVVLRRGEILRAALLQSTLPLTLSAVRWQIEERHALTRLALELDVDARERLLAAAAMNGMHDEATVVANLWSAAREVTGLVDSEKRSVDHTLDTFFGSLFNPAATKVRSWESSAGSLWHSLVAHLGNEWTMSALLMQLTGEDVRPALQATLIRHLAAHLDQGIAAWRNPASGQGFYAAWRLSAMHDWAWELDGLPEARHAIAQLPDDPWQVVLGELYRLGPDPAHWCAYLERLALELPGWSGMLFWRATHAAQGVGDEAAGEASNDPPIAIVDYLAVRLVLERLHAEHLVQRVWQLPLLLSELGDYFLCRPAELWVRHAYSVGDLPEDLHDRLCERMAAPVSDPTFWEDCAERLARWRATNASGEQESGVDGAAGMGDVKTWPLFRLAQWLGLCGRDLRAMGRAGAAALLQYAGSLNTDQRGYVWLLAYEHHHRQQLFSALLANHGRVVPVASSHMPAAQLIFCMDDREEGTRRHLEEVNPAIETFGAAGFFGLPIRWQGLDDAQAEARCPIAVRPQNTVREIAKPGAEARLAVRRRRRDLRLRWQEYVQQGSRRGWRAAWWVAICAPVALLVLFLRTLVPGRFGVFLNAWREVFDRRVESRLTHTAEAAESTRAADPASPRLGFSESEQVERVGGFLRSIGLVTNFAPLVILVGHGSDSRNNPHAAAYDCGACGGRHGGANARVFAALANRTEVRAQLALQGIEIPSGTHFLGAEHNTCDESMTWYDLDVLPENLRTAFTNLHRDINTALGLHAVERCRRLASAPIAPSPRRALRHLAARRHDLGQVRPELGHATVAAAFIGRRAMSRGVFFDRRAFLISYDPVPDSNGDVLEATLLSAGPVGAGISLEYYFSKVDAVDQARFGCGSKIMHNLVGLFGVMDGANSDLRTGLPRQMIEIHEAMRLLLVVEQTTEIIDAVYRRQPALQELIGNGWVVLAAKHPTLAQIQCFDPVCGWQPWSEAHLVVPEVERSSDWFAGRRDALAPVLLKRPLPV